MIQVKDIVGKIVAHIYEWRDYEVSNTSTGGVYIRVTDNDDPMKNNMIGIPHFHDELYPEFQVDRQFDERAKSVFTKRKKIFRVSTPLAKKLKGQAIKHIYFDHEKGYYELNNGYVISENLVLTHGVNAAGLILFDSIEQLLALDCNNLMQRLTL